MKHTTIACMQVLELYRAANSAGANKKISKQQAHKEYQLGSLQLHGELTP